MTFLLALKEIWNVIWGFVAENPKFVLTVALVLATMGVGAYLMHQEDMKNYKELKDSFTEFQKQRQEDLAKHKKESEGASITVSDTADKGKKIADANGDALVKKYLEDAKKRNKKPVVGDNSSSNVIEGTKKILSNEAISTINSLVRVYQ